MNAEDAFETLEDIHRDGNELDADTFLLNGGEGSEMRTGHQIDGGGDYRVNPGEAGAAAGNNNGAHDRRGNKR